jgi:hypothetical protein
MEIECEVLGRPYLMGNQVGFRGRDTATRREFDCLTSRGFDNAQALLNSIEYHWRTELLEGDFHTDGVFHIRELKRRP